MSNKSAAPFSFTPRPARSGWQSTIRGASWCFTADRLKRTRLWKDVYTIFAWRLPGGDSASLESMFEEF
jgi:hypothetical protein